MTQLKIKQQPQAELNRIRYSNGKYLKIKEYGKSYDILDYTEDELSEMSYGIYKDTKMILTDTGFINLNDVIETGCTLETVTYIKEPTQEDYKTNHHNRLKNIRTFYIRDYYLLTKKEVNGRTKHNITNLLCDIGAIKRGRNRYIKLYKISNDNKDMRTFSKTDCPNDLYIPIKLYINRLFYNDDYCIDKFRVDSKINIDR